MNVYTYTYIYIYTSRNIYRPTCIAPPSGGLRRRNSVGAAKKAAIVACHCSESPSSVHYSLYESRTTLVIWVTNYAHHQLWPCITNDIYVYRHRGVSLHRIPQLCVSLVIWVTSYSRYMSHELCTTVTNYVQDLPKSLKHPASPGQKLIHSVAIWVVGVRLQLYRSNRLHICLQLCVSVVIWITNYVHESPTTYMRHQLHICL